MTNMRWNGAIAAATACSLALVAVCVMARPQTVSLMNVFGNPPADPIVSPLMMGYQGGEGMARELARVAQPLGGAWNGAWTVPQNQLYGRRYGANAMPYADERRPSPSGYVPLSSLNENAGLQYYPSASYPSASYPSARAASLAQMRNSLSRQNEMRDISNVLGFTPQIDTPTQPSQARDEAPVPENIRKLFLGDGDESQAAAPYERDSKLATERAIAEKLRGVEDRQEGHWLLKEEAVADKLQSSVGNELSLQPMEEQLEKAVEINDEKESKARVMRRDALAELANYHQELRKQEKTSSNQVKFLRASHNYAQLAQKEMQDAVDKDQASQRVIQQSDQVLELAHEAQVKARITDDADALAQARADVNNELAAVHSAENNMAAARTEKQDAKYNTYMSKVLDRVRSKYVQGKEMDIGDLAKIDVEAHNDLNRATTEIVTAQRTRAAAERYLERAKWQDSVRNTASTDYQHASETLADMSSIEKDNVGLRRTAAASSELSHEGYALEQHAKQVEMAAAATAQPSHT